MSKALAEVGQGWGSRTRCRMQSRCELIPRRLSGIIRRRSSSKFTVMVNANSAHLAARSCPPPTTNYPFSTSSIHTLPRFRSIYAPAPNHLDSWQPPKTSPLRQDAVVATKSLRLMNSRKGFVKNVCKRLNADFNEPTGTLKKIFMSLQRCYKYKNVKKI